jgi:hypothetical protein
LKWQANRGAARASRGILGATAETAGPPLISLAIDKLMTTNETKPCFGGTKARALYRNYFIDLEQDDQGWRVIAVTHRLKGSSLLRPAFYQPDLVAAERFARAGIDEQLSPRWRRRAQALKLI